MSIFIVANNRSELGPLSSVIAALPEATVVGYSEPGPPAEVMSDAIRYFSDHLRWASLVVLLGDRYETLAAALAATFMRIPIAHIHGGETTTGAFDDAFRGAITLLTQQSGGIHFVATEMAGIRVKELIGG